MKKTEGIALGMSGILYWVAKVFAPIVWLLTKSTNGILRQMCIRDRSVPYLLEVFRKISAKLCGKFYLFLVLTPCIHLLHKHCLLYTSRCV